MSLVRVPPEQLFFHFPWKEMFRLVILPCFDLCRSNSFHVNLVYEIQCSVLATENKGGGFM